jgi:hypothetical protein
MAERTLRGARLGGQSFEDERGIEFAARQNVAYACPQGHEFEIPMSVEADVPAVWECPRCGAEALSKAGLERVAKVEKPVRTHWDMLLERRLVVAPTFGTPFGRPGAGPGFGPGFGAGTGFGPGDDERPGPGPGGPVVRGDVVE